MKRPNQKLSRLNTYSVNNPPVQWAVRLPTNKHANLLQFIHGDCALVYGSGIRDQPHNREFMECLIDSINHDPAFKEVLKSTIIARHNTRQKLNQLLGDK